MSLWRGCFKPDRNHLFLTNYPECRTKDGYQGRKHNFIFIGYTMVRTN